MNFYGQHEWEVRYGHKTADGQPQVGPHVDRARGEVHKFPIWELPHYDSGSFTQSRPEPHSASIDCDCVPLVQYIPRDDGTTVVAVRHSFELRGIQQEKAGL